MKIVTTGNPAYGLAKAINEVIGGDFASRSSGYDLSTDSGIEKFCIDFNNYDTIILNCYTEKMNNYSQARLLHELYIKYQASKKELHFVCIGSISDHINKEQPWLKYISYSAEKVALKTLCETINHNREIISPNIKCSYISLGHMHTPLVDRYHPLETKLDPIYVANAIKWIIDSPECIESLTLTKDKKNG
jgi:hypothetical protein